MDLFFEPFFILVLLLFFIRIGFTGMSKLAQFMPNHIILPPLFEQIVDHCEH